MYDTYLQDSSPHIVFAAVPDKNYFLAEKNGYPALDYTQMLSLFENKLSSLSYIDLFPYLSVEDYYRTE